MLKTIKLSIFFGLAFVTLTSTTGVFAQGNSTANSNRNNVKEVNPVAAANRSDKSVAAAQNRSGTGAAMMIKNNLSAARLKTCEARQERISNRFTNLLTLGTRASQNFAGFVARVDYYYVNTLQAQGYSLDNYDELMADIETNEQAVTTALDAVRGVGQDFSCTSEDPKGQADAFRANMQQVIAANKEYKNSVRAYVAAVRDLAIQVRTAKLSTTPAENTSDATSAAETAQ